MALKSLEKYVHKNKESRSVFKGVKLSGKDK